MVNLMRFSNCRAQDVVAMRGCELTIQEGVWTYCPETHKNSWRGQDRVIYLGPQAQEIIRPFLNTDLQAYLFSPRTAVEEHNAKRRVQRKTKRTPSELRKKRKKVTQQQPGARHTQSSTFQQAVRRACRRAKVPDWSVLQIRHSRGTEVRERFGVEGAAASMGHKRVETAQIYAEKNAELAKRIASWPDVGTGRVALMSAVPPVPMFFFLMG